MENSISEVAGDSNNLKSYKLIAVQKAIAMCKKLLSTVQ